jgi:hypothetical protein
VRYDAVNNKIKSFFIFAVSYSFLINIFDFSQDYSNQSKIREEVTVTTVEVPVRVLRDGQVVKGLNKDDFEVYENGLKQQISGFEIVSRRIAGPVGLEQIPSFERQKPRLFLLIFDIFDYNEAIAAAIDYFFKSIYRDSDQLIILTEDRLLDIERRKNADDVKTNLKETLKNYKMISIRNYFRAYLELSEECDRLLDKISTSTGAATSSFWADISFFYEHYERIWNAYRDRYLMPDMSFYQVLLKKIKAVKAEKWALCFQQRELFPQLKSHGRLEDVISMTINRNNVDPQDQVHAQMIRNSQNRLQESFEISKQFPSERMKNLFLEAGVTFHLILMKSPKTLLSPDLELREVAQNYEECYREISRSTGGYLTFSNKAMEALKEASEKEDYHYLLVYQPKGPIETRGKNIEVKVRREGTRVYSLKQYTRLEGPVVSIADVSTAQKTMRFTLKNYTMMNTDKGQRGVAEVHITLFDDQSNVAFSEGKVLELVSSESHVTIDFSKLRSGPYFLIIDVLDKITNEKDVYSRMFELY